MKTRIIWAAISPFFLNECNENAITIKPEIKTLTEAVYASGNIFPKEEYLVFANADGLLEDVLVAPGDTVERGRLLFTIERDAQTVRQQTAAEIYKTVRKNNASDSPALLEAESKMKNAEEKMQNDSIQFIRFRNLLEKRAIAKAEYDQFALAYALSKNDYQARKNSYEKLKRQLYVELQQAKNQYRQSRREEHNYLVHAQIEGLIYEVYKERGEAVRRNEPVALLGSKKEFFLQLKVDEVDISRIKQGQEVLVKVDLEKDKIWKAKVLKIHPKLNVQDQSFRVDAAFIGETPVLYHGASVEANIIIQTKEKVLTIPKTLLAAADSLWIKTAEGEKKIRISKGVEDFDFVEVLSGITPDSEIIHKYRTAS